MKGITEKVACPARAGRLLYINLARYVLTSSNAATKSGNLQESV